MERIHGIKQIYSCLLPIANTVSNQQCKIFDPLGMQEIP